MNSNRQVLRKNQIDRLKAELPHKKVAYFSAQLGWGKTITVLQYFKQNKLEYRYISAKAPNYLDLIKEAVDEEAEHIVIDDAQQIAEDGDRITELIADSSHLTKFYILGRSKLPDYLKAYYTTRILALYDREFFAFAREEIKELGRLHGKELTTKDTDRIYNFTKGCIFGVLCVLYRMKNESFTDEILKLTMIDIFEYLDQTLFKQFPRDLQTFLLNIAHLESFTVKQAAMLCGQVNVQKYLSRTLSIGSFLSATGADTYAFLPIYHSFLEWKQAKDCSREFVNNHYEITALYFALEDDVPNALKYYSLANNLQKVSELLIEHYTKHSGDAYYYETKEYYLSLPESIVSQSPELMSALSMIASISFKIEESERYYKMLEEFERSLQKTDEKKSVSRERLAFLDIALPHRGTKNLIDIFGSFSTLILKNCMELQLMSFTGNMPGIMNGGKDFCEWSKKDRFLYQTMKIPLITVLGKRSSGIAEIGLGESLFEKNYDGNFTEELTLLNTGLCETEITDNIQLQFAAVAITARIFVTQGNMGGAVSMVEKLKRNIGAGENIQKNIDAFLVYLHMHKNDTESVNRWFDKAAPDEYSDFCITERYTYLIKIRIYIIKRMYSEALALLSRADNYFLSYDRKYCHMEAQILKAIVLYRMQDDNWHEVLDECLKQCESYKFIRIVSKFGAAILDLLTEAKLNVDSPYRQRLIDAARSQALLYPKFMRSESKQDFSLTETEKTVLKLLCDGLTNKEISHLMDITERTVKFHLTNIYAKLNVSGRVSAVNLVSEQGIF